MFPVNEVISVACAAHRKNGFVKKADTYFAQDDQPKVSNSSMLYQHFYGDNKIEVLECDREQSEQVIDYLTGLTFKAFDRELTDFEANTLRLVTSKEIDNKSLGIAASLPKVFLNKQEQDVWLTREQELADTSEFVGKLNSRCNFDLVIENVRYIKNTGSSLYCCSESGKNIVKFFGDGLGNVGDPICITAFVKSQSISKFSDGKETMVNRVKVV